ncbi:MAG: ribosome maturation factor RimM [Oscillospiraceae bacterium]|nr:ribosome maturation factor RimM [Oscillospiraceae bacterium]
MKDYLEIGKIVTVHGLRGDVKVQPWCDSPEFLCAFPVLYLGKEKKEVEVLDARVQKNMAILRLDGYETVEQAEMLRNQMLYLHREDVELEDDTYFIQDLIGLDVLDADSGVSYGTLKDVLQTGANDVYVVQPENGKEVLIPAIPDVIVETNLEIGCMKIRPLEGLLDAN